MTLDERLFAWAYEDAPEAVVALSSDGAVHTWSRGAQELFSCAAAEAHGRPFSSFFGDPSEGERLLELARNSGLVRQFRAPVRRPNGAREFAWLTARALREGAATLGYLVGASAAAPGEGRERAVREALPRLERFSAVGQMAAAFAHDVRGPLHVIASTAEYALDFLSPAPELREGLDMIARNARRATGSIKALLEFARAGRCELRPGSLNDVVQSASEFFEDACRKRNIEVERRLRRVPALLLDPHHLGAAVYNLMANAVDAMPKAGCLRIDTAIEPGSDRVTLTVVDTGTGMDPDVLHRVEEGFFSTKETGSGLGLYLTRRILAEHGAEMRIESRPGAGTTVTVSFAPVADAQPDRSAPSSEG